MIAERRAFGDRLRRHRQRKNLSLTEIAAITKVGASHYTALERGDCSRWPGGVYNRAFIRAYARRSDSIRMKPRPNSPSATSRRQCDRGR